MQIRPAQQKDIPQLCELSRLTAVYHQQFDSIYTLAPNATQLFAQNMQRAIDENNTGIFVAAEGDTITGVVIGKLTQYPPVFAPISTGMIDEMGVLPEHRGKGTGSALVQALMQWFKQNNVQRVQLKVNMQNEVGYNFWRKQGFYDIIIQMAQDI